MGIDLQICAIYGQIALTAEIALSFTFRILPCPTGHFCESAGMSMEPGSFPEKHRGMML